MEKKLFTAMAAACVLLGGAIVAAGPAGAHADDALIQYGEPDPLWVMPDLKDKILSRAEQEVEVDVEQTPLTFNVVAPNHEPVYNLQNWVVCGESPAEGKQALVKDGVRDTGRGAARRGELRRLVSRFEDRARIVIQRLTVDLQHH